MGSKEEIDFESFFCQDVLRSQMQRALTSGHRAAMTSPSLRTERAPIQNFGSVCIESEILMFKMDHLRCPLTGKLMENISKTERLFFVT